MIELANQASAAFIADDLIEYTRAFFDPKTGEVVVVIRQEDSSLGV